MSALALVTSEEVLDSMGQNPDLMGDSIPAIESAILRAAIKVEGILRTSLKHVIQDDYFLITEMDGMPLRDRYSLMLTNGFVRSDVPATVSVCETANGTFSSVLNPVVVNVIGKVLVPLASTYSITSINYYGYTRGAQPINDLVDKYIKVSYASGFSEDTEVPDEIKQAMLCIVPLLLLSSQAAMHEPKVLPSVVARSASLNSVALDMLSRYLRPVGPSIRPLYTVVSS